MNSRLGTKELDPPDENAGVTATLTSVPELR